MKRLISRSKVFFELRTVRIAVSLAVCASCTTGLITVYYIRNSTFGYASELSTNQQVSKKRGGFESEADYLTFRETDKSALQDERYLHYAHRLATSANMIHPADTDPKTRLFLATVSVSKPKDNEPLLSEEDGDRFAADMRQVVTTVVDYANELDINKDLEDKKTALVCASKIAATLDCRYSFSAYMERIYACTSILNELVALKKSDAPDDLKKQVIDACLPLLKKPLRTDSMLNKEQLRLLSNFDIAQGIAVVKKNSINYRQPQSLPIWLRWIQKLPNVSDAMKSRVYEAFRYPLNSIVSTKQANPQDFMTGVDPGALGMFWDRVGKNRASTDLIYQFAPDLMNTRNTSAVYHMESFLRNLSKSDAK